MARGGAAGFQVGVRQQLEQHFHEIADHFSALRGVATRKSVRRRGFGRRSQEYRDLLP